MSSEPKDGALKSIAPARVADELRKLSEGRAKGDITPNEYEHRFARMIGELRDRRIDGSRAEIMAALTPLRDNGVINTADWDRLTKQLGLV